MRSSKLISGHTKSCGCYSHDRVIETDTTHGMTHTRLYRIWASMKSRCTNPKVRHYEYYGGRGITVCEEWAEFVPFYRWAMSHGYAENLTIDRVDNDKGYSPDNCRWATRSEQRTNQRRMKT